MTKPLPQPEMLLDLDSVTLRHPMWKHPEGDPKEPHNPIWHLRFEIARKLTAFDGKPGPWSLVIGYLESVYQATVRDDSTNFLWVLGQITWLRIDAVRRIQDRLELPHLATTASGSGSCASSATTSKTCARCSCRRPSRRSSNTEQAARDADHHYNSNEGN